MEFKNKGEFVSYYQAKGLENDQIELMWQYQQELIDYLTPEKKRGLVKLVNPPGVK